MTGLYEHDLFPSEISTLPAPLRARLAEALPLSLSVAHEVATDDGDTVKWAFRLPDGATIETVLMKYRDRVTVCISTQAGCAMACSFCATGQAGFTRQLTVGEVMEQVVRAARTAAPRRLSHVVFMGMGEPLANYDVTVEVIRRLHAERGMSARNITVSTVGVAPAIERLAHEGRVLGGVARHGHRGARSSGGEGCPQATARRRPFGHARTARHGTSLHVRGSGRREDRHDRQVSRPGHGRCPRCVLLEVRQLGCYEWVTCGPSQ